MRIVHTFSMVRFHLHLAVGNSSQKEQERSNIRLPVNVSEPECVYMTFRDFDENLRSGTEPFPLPLMKAKSEQ